MMCISFYSVLIGNFGKIHKLLLYLIATYTLQGWQRVVVIGGAAIYCTQQELGGALVISVYLLN